jgi:hypothetical protein
LNDAVEKGIVTGRLRFQTPGCATFLLVAVGGCMGWVWWASQRGLTVAKLERSIRAEVPPRCDRQVIDAWFDRHRFPHSWSEDTRVGGRGNQTMAELAGLRDEELSGVCYAVVEGPEVNVDLVFSGRIGIYFFFDERGRYAGHYIDAFAYEL